MRAWDDTQLYGGERRGVQLIQSAWPVDEDSGITAFLQLHAASDLPKTIYNGAGGERHQLEHPRQFARDYKS